MKLFKRWWQQSKNLYHALESQWWRACFGWPDRKLCILGVTGTDGKTTTSIMLASILQAAFGAKHIGLLSTEFIYIGDEVKANVTHMTTLESRLVYQYLRTMGRRGVTHLVLELTSHALDQNRLAGVRLAGAIITNITHEHLDYHQTMSAYAAAKWAIVKYLKPNAPLIINADDFWSMKKAQQSRVTNHKLRITQFTRAQARSVKTTLPGDFNQENALAASLLAKAMGLSQKNISAGLACVTAVPGRMEWIELENRVRVLIDFALTPASLERLYRYVRSEVAGKIYAVFGAAGRRDRRKRPRLAQVVARFADEIILTQDEPYTEPEEQIYSELEVGLRGVNIPWQRIADRREALRYALRKTRPGDVVIVTGMGNFSTRVIGTTHLPWKDADVVRALSQELKHS